MLLFYKVVKKVLQIGDALLRAPNQPVTNFADNKIQQVLLDLVETMRANDLIGLAAPQIGVNYDIFITEPRPTKARIADQADDLRYFFNSKLVQLSLEQTVIFEGCGCVINGQLLAPVLRRKEITVESFNKEGRKFQLRCDGLLARVIQHELDHISGKEFTERVTDYNRMMSFEHYVMEAKGSREQVSASIITVKEYKEI